MKLNDDFSNLEAFEKEIELKGFLPLWNELQEQGANGHSYEGLKEWQAKFEPHGLTFDFGLDADPYDFEFNSEQQEIKNNKLFTDFIGLPKNQQGFYCFNKNNSIGQYGLDRMHYRDDFNWIIAVVDKIETIEDNRYTVEINQGHCNIYDMIEEEEIISIFNESKIDSVNIACLDFVKMKSNSNSNDSELLEEFEEGAQNRFRNNDFRSFEEWKESKIDSPPLEIKTRDRIAKAITHYKTK